jgi:hypothetical protein
MCKITNVIQILQSSGHWRGLGGGGDARTTMTESNSFDVCHLNLTCHHAQQNILSLIGDNNCQTKAIPVAKPREGAIIVGRHCVAKDSDVSSQGDANNL